jgi:Zn-dependent protease
MVDYKNIAEIIFSLAAVIISLTIHEFSHALISTAQGDDVPGSYGRLTLNPLAHLDLMGFISLMLLGFGWAKPVPISSRYYKNKRLGIILTSIAGPVSNLLLAFFSMLAFYLFNVQSEGVSTFLSTLITMNIGLAVFNLIPIPPLDGSKVFAEIFGGKIADIIYGIEGKGMFLLILLLLIPGFSDILYSIINAIGNGMESFIQIFF